MGPTAGQAGNPPPGPADSRMALPATRTAELIATSHAPTNKGKLVGAFLIRNPKIPASLAPLHAVRRESATTMAMLCKEVRQLMEQGLPDFVL